MGVFDRNRVETWKQGPRKGVCIVCIWEGDVAAGTADVPQWEGRKMYMERQAGVIPWCKHSEAETSNELS